MAREKHSKPRTRRQELSGFFALGITLLAAVVLGWFAISAYIDPRRGSERALSFDGSHGLVESIGVFSNSYTIDLILRSRPRNTSNGDPMAFLGGGVAILHGQNKYKFFVAGEGVVISAGSPIQWQRISIVVDTSDHGRIYLNGKKIWSGKGKFGLSNSAIFLGRSAGNKQFWSGNIFRLRVFDGVNFLGDFDPNDDILIDSVSLVYEKKGGGITTQPHIR